MHATRQLTSFVVLLVAVLAATAPATLSAGEPPSPEKERELIAILRSDKPKAEKAMACKNLAVHGTNEAVPELAKLLTDEQLASWARIPLEAIPGPVAAEALRNSLGSLQGKLLVGTINSIGVRRDASAIETLTGRLQDNDVEVASAAAVALGHVGNADAAKSLRQSLSAAPAAVRSAVAEGLVLCAERALKDGDAAHAVEVYDAVRMADVPKQRILEATRGAIVARNNEGIALLLEQFKSDDKAMFQLALQTSRELPGKEVGQALAGELKRATPDRAALVITALADRKDSKLLPTILAAAGEGPKPVRLAAINALGHVGDESCLSQLLKVAVENDDELVQATKTALADLPGDKVNNEIVAQLADANAKSYRFLIEIVGLRRIAAVQALVKALDHSDKSVRDAAVASLGKTVPAKDLNVLISQFVSPRHAEDAESAQQALKTACIRMPDRDATSTELAAAIESAPAKTKVAILEILSEVGGAKALATVGSAAKSNDADLQDAGSRILGKWVSADAAPVLLDLAKTGPGNKYQIRALRGYIGIARRFAKNLPEDQRLELCRNAFELSKQPAEQKLVVEMLKLNPNLETLKLAVKATKEFGEVKQDATQSVLTIAQKLSDKADEVRKLLAEADLAKAKIEIVKAEYGSDSTKKDVTETVRKLVKDSQLINLSSANFNEAFGGDPAPGAAKTLKIQYKLNDKSGEVTISENALVILTMPK